MPKHPFYELLSMAFRSLFCHFLEFFFFRGLPVFRIDVREWAILIFPIFAFSISSSVKNLAFIKSILVLNLSIPCLTPSYKSLPFLSFGLQSADPPIATNISWSKRLNSFLVVSSGVMVFSSVFSQSATCFSKFLISLSCTSIVFKRGSVKWSNPTLLNRFWSVWGD